MARQSAAFHPVSYTLWYEHLAGVNPALSKVLVAHLDANHLLSEDEAYEVVEVVEAKTREVGALTEELERARTEAQIDPLTGLKNRRGFERAAAELFEQRREPRLRGVTGDRR